MRSSPLPVKNGGFGILIDILSFRVGVLVPEDESEGESEGDGGLDGVGDGFLESGSCLMSGGDSVSKNSCLTDSVSDGSGFGDNSGKESDGVAEAVASEEGIVTCSRIALAKLSCLRAVLANCCCSSSILFAFSLFFCRSSLRSASSLSFFSFFSFSLICLSLIFGE